MVGDGSAENASPAHDGPEGSRSVRGLDCRFHLSQVSSTRVDDDVDDVDDVDVDDGDDDDGDGDDDGDDDVDDIVDDIVDDDDDVCALVVVVTTALDYFVIERFSWEPDPYDMFCLTSY